LKSQIHIPANR